MSSSPELYARLLQRLPSRTVAERPAPRLSELELQSRIFGGEFGICWSGIDGEAVEIIHFGLWNREPGPDFCGALVRINGVEISGDIEVDPDVRDWEHHGHANNPAFENVILHVFLRCGPRRFFTRTPAHRSVTQILLPARGSARLPRPPGPSEVLGPEAAEILIREAARFRLGRKAESFHRTARLRGRDEALFQGIAVGLGYKNNKIPFQLLAQRCGLQRARQADGESLLLGIAGFLEAEDFDCGDGEVRVYLRGLWESWWAMRDRERRMILPRSAWKFAALRPSNHPHRRAGALAVVAGAFDDIQRAAGTGDPAVFLERLRALHHPYWDWHASLARERLAGATAIIGEERARDLAINVLFPSLGAEAGWERLSAFPGPAPSRRVRQSAGWLCGSMPPTFLRSALVQQGLLQLADDFFPSCPQKIWRECSHGWTPASVPAKMPR